MIEQHIILSELCRKQSDTIKDMLELLRALQLNFENTAKELKKLMDEDLQIIK